ncbi:amino acid permease [Parasaccharibacter apium]|uniref:Amino acid permease n=1 Tax=Parasaccharibacter apium TaxID=1510841 RepID=A0A7U7G6E0_9PROT|nr:amino acid permease [Parasaccharibacter apium]POS62855.1 amino acid permease [Parasaccharibacter apium]POS62907.1 amino acid permease [Parasaccharibacter apium]POS62956.1 amino acid permease [Parasaccharibacter apium]CDG33971.1 Amino acid permease [Parasaccharibacter apium]
MRRPFWRTKPISQAAAPETGLHRVLGPWQLIALGVGVTVGAGLFSMTGVAAGQYAGPAVTLSFMIAAIACAFAGLCYAELAGMIPEAGSAYTYAYTSMGEGIAWIIGWDLILEYTVNASTVAASWSGYFASLMHEIGISLDPRLLAPTGASIMTSDGQFVRAWFNAPAVFIICAVTCLLMCGTRGSSKINMAIVALKLLIIGSVTVICLPHISAANLHPFIPANTGQFGQFGASGVMRAAGLIFFAYIGFDIVSTAAQDSHNPQRNIPLSVLGSLVLAAVIYAIFSFVIVGVVNYRAMLHDPNPVATVLHSLHIPWFSALITFGIALGYISVIYGLLMGQSRICLSMARDGLLPSLFETLNRRSRTPWSSHIITAVVASILAACLPIDILGKMTSIGTLLAFIIVCFGVMVLRLRQPKAVRRFKTPGGPFLVPILGILSCGTVMLSMDIMTWIRLALWLLVGLGIYAVYGLHRSRLKHTHH